MWNGDIPLVMAYEQWYDPWFFFWFVSASVMGFVLNFSIVHCTKVNSALTTTVIGMPRLRVVLINGPTASVSALVRC
jgi:solute carrier family 35 protein